MVYPIRGGVPRFVTMRAPDYRIDWDAVRGIARRRLGADAAPLPDESRAAAEAFYRDALGAEVTPPLPQPEHGVTVVFITLPNTKIELLEPFVPPPLAARLKSMPEGWRIDGELRRVIVVFCEVLGLAGGDRQEEAKQLARAALRSFRRYGGVVTKTDVAPNGHRLMAVFGLHAPTENDTERAVLSALETTAVFQAQAARADLPLTLKVGVHVGLGDHEGSAGRQDRHVAAEDLGGDDLGARAGVLGRERLRVQQPVGHGAVQFAGAPAEMEGMGQVQDMRIGLLGQRPLELGAVVAATNTQAVRDVSFHGELHPAPAVQHRAGRGGEVVSTAKLDAGKLVITTTMDMGGNAVETTMPIASGPSTVVPP